MNSVSDEAIANVMHAIPQNSKFSFGGLLKQLFRRPERNQPVTDLAESSATQTNGVGTPPAFSDEPVEQGVTLPLPSVLATLPVELRTKILSGGARDISLNVPVGKVLSELPMGRVTMTFGELRRTAPQLFAPGSESDGMLVALPLKEILAQLDPALLARRPAQRTAPVLPEEIAGPFAGRGQGLAIGELKTGPTPAMRGPGKFPSSPCLPALPAAPVSPPSAPVPFSLPVTDERPVSERIRIALPTAVAPTTLPKPRFSIPPPTVSLPLKNGHTPPSGATTLPPFKPDPVAPAPDDAGALLAPVLVLAAAWPEPLRQEIAALNLNDAQFALPEDLIVAALKRGRVAFPWKTLRSWMRPAPPAGDSVHDATELALPLSIIAPLFLARHRPADKLRRADAEQTIPELFFRGPKAATPALKMANTNGCTRREELGAVGRDAADHEAPSNLPGDIVSRAVELEGVAGALAALPDGLLVTGRIPPEFNGDTLAAFLPQIFSKVSQSAKELRLGDLSELSFTIGDVPWRVFRGDALFFAAFGCPGGSLPNGELTRLATELNRQR